MAELKFLPRESSATSKTKKYADAIHQIPGGTRIRPGVSRGRCKGLDPGLAFPQALRASKQAIKGHLRKKGRDANADMHGAKLAVTEDKLKTASCTEACVK